MRLIEHEVSNVYVYVRKVRTALRRDPEAIIQRADCPAASTMMASAVIGWREDGFESVNFLEKSIGFPHVLREFMTDLEIESSLRLVGKCVKNSCPHWADSCILGHAVASIAPSDGTIPMCSISDTCRWKRENGETVCIPCRGILNNPMGGQ
jgi:hypothetical protein